MIETLTSLLTGLVTNTKEITIVLDPVETEDRAKQIVESWRSQQAVGGYILKDEFIKYKCKKDKEGNVVDEHWIVTLKMENDMR